MTIYTTVTAGDPADGPLGPAESARHTNARQVIVICERVAGGVMPGDPNARVVLQDAIDHRNKTLPRMRLPDGRLVPFPICAFRDFAMFGKGVLLYFTMLRKLYKAFLGMFLLAIPQIAFSLMAHDIQPTPFFAEQTTLGAFGSANVTQIEVPLIGQSVPKSNVGLAIVALDAVIVLYFYVFLRLLKREQIKVAAESDDTTITAADYTVRVKNLPPTLTDRYALYEFFQERWGKVVDAAVSFNDSDLVALYIERGLIKHEMARWRASEKSEERTAKLDSLAKRADKHDAKIDAFKGSFQRRPVDAYISFNSAHDRHTCRKAYPNTCWSRCCMSRRLRFQGYRIQVTDAQEPSNILFHNLKYSESSRCLRRWVTTVATVVLMMVSLVIVFLGSEQKQNLTRSTTTCLGVTVSRDQALAGTDVDCYCASLSTAQLYNDKSICQGYVEGVAMSKLMTGMIALTIFIVNVFLRSAVVFLVKWEKHNTLSSQERAVTGKLFVGLFVNTGIIIVLVNGNLSALALGSIFSGAYNDVTASWYRDVGISVVMTMVLNVLNPHLMPVLQIPVAACSRYCSKAKMKTQKDLNELYSGPEFVLSDRYAGLLNTLFVSLLFSAGIPILLLTAAATFATMYLFDKIALLRLYRNPPMLDESLAMFAVQIMRWAVALHAAFALWMYSFPGILPSPNIGRSSTIADQGTSQAPLLGDRLTSIHGFILFILFIILVVHMLLGRFWCCCRGKHAKVAQGEEQMSYLDAIRAGIRIDSYHMHDQAQYMDAFLKTMSMKQMHALEPLTEELAEARGLRKPPAAVGPGPAPAAGAAPTPAQPVDIIDNSPAMMTVQCPNCGNFANVPVPGLGVTPGQIFSCPCCGAMFAIAPPAMPGV